MDSLFFFVSKLVSPIVRPDLGLVGLVCLGTLLVWNDRATSARFLLLSAAISMLTITLFPIGSWLIFPLEQRFAILKVLPERLDGIIVLSGGINAASTEIFDQVQFNEQADRDIMFIQLAKRYPEARLIYSGGSSSLTRQQHRGADAGARFISEMGINTNRIAFERESRNTHESAVFLKNLANPRDDEKWILITSANHMPRSVGVFCGVGWRVIPYPVDFRSQKGLSFAVEIGFAENLQGLTDATREWLGLVAYWATGRTHMLLPDGCEASSQ